MGAEGSVDVGRFEGEEGSVRVGSLIQVIERSMGKEWWHMLLQFFLSIEETALGICSIVNRWIVWWWDG